MRTSDKIFITLILSILVVGLILIEVNKVSASDEWNSTSSQFSIRIHDKPAHGARGFVNVYIFDLILPDKLDRYSELFAITFSALWEVKDKLTHTAEAKDFYSEVGGITFVYFYKKLPKDAQIFGTPLVAWGFYQLIKVRK